jgi:hypothetical protein
MAAWKWAAATTIGTSHIRLGTRRQDAYRCYSPSNSPDWMICVVSDGAGTAQRGGEGASLTCRTIALCAQAHLAFQKQHHTTLDTDTANVPSTRAARGLASLPTDEQVMQWIDCARDRIAGAAARKGLTPRDFACTLICVLTDGDQTLVVHVGDGFAAFKEVGASSWSLATWPDHGEYASTTYFVTDDPQAKAQVVRSSAPVSMFAVSTDGMERLALNIAQKSPHPGFFEALAGPVLASPTAGKDQELSAALKAMLDSPRVCERTDDDKTLVVVARHAPALATHTPTPIPPADRVQSITSRDHAISSCAQPAVATPTNPASNSVPSSPEAS